MKLLKPHFKILEGLRKKIQGGLWDEHRIHCKTGEWMNCAVLKLQKKSWTINGMGEGVFFSIWIGERDLQKNRFNYNIHAYKMRAWKSHSIKPVEFAADFRSRLNPDPKRWPHLRTDYGPQTLMQGWQELDLKTLEKDALILVNEFVSIHGIIDEMIDRRKKPSREQSRGAGKP